MAVILGLNTHHAGSSAALLIDGLAVAAIAEERLNRLKYYAGFPAKSIQQVMRMGGITFKDIDYIAVGRDPAANRAQKIQYLLKNPARLFNLLKIRSARSDLRDLRSLLISECGADPGQLRFKQINVEHHLAHIASAYFISPWEHAAGISIDGSGDFVTCMLTECEGKSIRVKRRIYVPHSLGTLYAMVSQFIGYGKYGDEGKVMGLAPYGDETLVSQLSSILQLTADGFRLNPDFFLPFGTNQGIEITPSGEMKVLRHYSDHMVRLFGLPRDPKEELTRRDQDLAYATQHIFERGYMHMLNLLHKLVPTHQVVMAGGAVLNSVSNGKLFHETPFTKTVIQPASGDEGLSLGAALYVSQSVLGEKQRYVMTDAYLGPEYSDHEIKSVLNRHGVDYQEMDRATLLQTTAAEIEANQVAGWFQGRMEWGPRALGNRSILANPTSPDMKDILNARIKRREWFRPFAPVVLAERQAELFEHDHPSPFMLHVYKFRPEWRSRLPAVNHVDDTGRLQSVSRHENPIYYDLVKAFGERTGVPVLINTSFNENEPIVCTPEEAVDCYIRTKMDVLVIGPYFCKKANKTGTS